MYIGAAWSDHRPMVTESLRVGIRHGVDGRRRAVPPHTYFVCSAVFHYLGPSFAVLLFARVAPLGVAWLRIVSAAVVFAAWRRPWRTLLDADRATSLRLIEFGVVLAAMNTCFYLAIARLPLATVSAIEFLPVIALAAVGVRSLRNGLALLLAVGGVFLLTSVQLRGQPLGVAFALANAGLFAIYIVLAHRIAGTESLAPIDGLAVAMLIACVVIVPLGSWSVAQHLSDAVIIGAGIGVGVTSSVIPYVCDQLAMARLPRATYALFVSLLPAVATVVGVIVLAQLPSVIDLAGLALVMLGIASHRPAKGQPAPTTRRAGEASRDGATPGPDASQVHRS